MNALAQLILCQSLSAPPAVNPQTQLLVEHVSTALTHLQMLLAPGALNQSNMSDVVSLLVQQALVNPALLQQQQEMANLQQQVQLALLRHVAAPPPAPVYMDNSLTSLLMAASCMQQPMQQPNQMAGMHLPGLGGVNGGLSSQFGLSDMLSGGHVSPYASSTGSPSHSSCNPFGPSLFSHGCSSASQSDVGSDEASLDGSIYANGNMDPSDSFASLNL